MFHALDRHDAIGLDTESSGPLLVHLRGKKSMVNMYRSTLTGISLASIDGKSYYVPLEHRQGNLSLAHLPKLEGFLTRFDGRVWVHNLKHELLALDRPPAVRYGPRLASDLHSKVRVGQEPNWLCTQIGCWLAGLQGTEKSPYSLKTLAPKHLGIDMFTFDDTTGGLDFSQLLPKDGLDYACEDAEAALLLGEHHVRPTLTALDLERWYLDVEMPFCWVLRDLESRGMALDVPRHLRTLEGLTEALRPLEREWDFEAPAGVKINSPKGLASLYSSGIWDSRGIPRKKTGPSTEGEYIRWQLQRCEPGSLGHTLAVIKTSYAEVKKMHSTYGHKLIEIAGQYPDGRLHGSFHQTGTATGRLSSSYPNLQNIPKRTKLGKTIRESFVPSQGYEFVSGDYSQVELRVLAHFCKSGGLFEGYKQGADVHAATAKDLSELVGHEIDRNQGKTWNFAVIYGAGDKKLSKSLSLPLEVTKQGSSAHKKLHPEVYETIQRMRDAGARLGYVKTIAGRRRPVDIQSWREKMAELKQAGHRYSTSDQYKEAWRMLGREERRASNTPIQGSAGDIVKVGMLRYWREWGQEAPMVCQIHDDIMVESFPDRREVTKTSLKHHLETAWPLRVPLVVEPEHGERWSDF